MTILGWNTRTRRWSDDHGTQGSDWIPLPDDLQQRVVTNPDSLAEAAGDLGGQHHQAPGLLLRPRSSADVAAAVRFARAHDVPGVVARGTMHATGGQALAQNNGALYLDMRGLDQAVVEPAGTHIICGGGATLRSAAEAAWAQGKRLTSGLTGYTGLTVGGVLSVGGWSLDHVAGSIGDYADELELVDGTGAIHTLSSTQNPELHKRARGGLGQFGIITRAQLRLSPARPYASARILTHLNHDEMLRAVRSLIRRGQLDSVYGRRRGDEPGWEVLAASYHERPDDPMPAMLAGMPDPGSHSGDPIGYLDHVLLHDTELYDPLIEQGWAAVPKRWWDFFLPDAAVAGFLATAETAPSEDMYRDAACALVIPKYRASVQTGLALPPASRSGDRSELVWLADGLCDPGLDYPGDLDRWASAAEVWIEYLARDAAQRGATVYHIGNVEHSMFAHYSRAVDHVTALRAEYDPAGLFGRGLWRTTRTTAPSAQPAPTRRM